MSIKSCDKTLDISTNRTNDEVEAMYIASRRNMSGNPTVSSLIPLENIACHTADNSNAIGTYHLYCKLILMYVGQGIILNRVRKNLNEFKSYSNKGLKKADLTTGNVRWSVCPKLYNKSKNLKDWKVQFVSFDTGNLQLDKIHAKNHEDVMIEEYNPPLNYKKGDNT